jgi:hypothetical protein
MFYWAKNYEAYKYPSILERKYCTAFEKAAIGLANVLNKKMTNATGIIVMAKSNIP